ncbi:MULTISPECIES: AraC family transcriptional regulator [unclassified Streptomyces]|uniref:AraC family transcriptional regulator n=1 Tax=unclassified Streptomyces TaxID=2593676 RepID=UPI0033FB38E8
MQATSHSGTRGTPTASRLSFRTGDLDEARQVIGEAYYATSMDVLDRTHRLDAVFDVGRLGPLTLGDLRWGTDVRMRFGDLGAYHVDVPLSGELTWRQARTRATATARRAAVFHPEGEPTLERWNRDCRLLAVKVEAPDLLRHLEVLLDRSVPAGTRLAPELDLTQGPGLSWSRMVALVVREMDNEHGALAQPLMAARLQDALLTGLLLAAGHRYREELDKPVRAVLPGPVKRVVDAIHAHPERPYTTTELAGIGQVGVRWLQEGFRRHLGMSPMAYLRDVRMSRVHAELRQADPARLTVGEAAYRWGFTHLGRFADSYRTRFGELPSRTLAGS